MKGMRMAGHKGNSRVKLQNLVIVKVLPEQNLLFIKGAIPGHKGSIVTVLK
jgi:large subunit ribosomal protein L3